MTSESKQLAKAKAKAAAERAWFTKAGWQSYEMLRGSIKPQPDHGFIYFIEERGDGPSALKIGFAKDPLRRIALLQTGNPRPLQVRQCFVAHERLERWLHRRWAEVRLASEWFDVAYREAILAMADAIAEAMCAGNWAMADTLIRQSVDVPPAYRSEQEFEEAARAVLAGRRAS